MGNPLSEVLTCLFLEILESSPFKYRLPINTSYFIYLDNDIIFLSKKIKMEEIEKN